VPDVAQQDGSDLHAVGADAEPVAAGRFATNLGAPQVAQDTFAKLLPVGLELLGSFRCYWVARLTDRRCRLVSFLTRHNAKIYDLWAELSSHRPTPKLVSNTWRIFPPIYFFAQDREENAFNRAERRLG